MVRKTRRTRNAVPLGLQGPYPLGIPYASHDQQGAAAAVTYENGKPEVSLNQKVNQKVKKLIQQLGEAIHESVSESEQIAGVVKDLRVQGFDVLLMLEATIGLNEVDSDDELEGEETAQLQLTSGDPIDGPFSHNDMNFLKSLRISLPEDGSVGDAAV